MPKKSKKSKSKRTTLKQKYKVIKKVKEHHKKKAKLAKKSGRKVKPPKDPGIPSQWPFKQELVKELEWEKQRALAEQQRKKEERRLARVGCMAHECLLRDLQALSWVAAAKRPSSTSHSYAVLLVQLWTWWCVGTACPSSQLAMGDPTAGACGRSMVRRGSSSSRGGTTRTWQPP